MLLFRHRYVRSGVKHGWLNAAMREDHAQCFATSEAFLWHGKEREHEHTHLCIGRVPILSVSAKALSTGMNPALRL